MNGSNVHTLEMHFRDRVIGAINFDINTEQFSIEYTQAWQEDGFPISPKLLLDGQASSSQISIYLTNLLPENKGLDHLIEALGIARSNTFALIKGIGFDTSGAILYLPVGTKAPATSFTPISKADLIKRIEDPEYWPMEVWDGKPRLSVAGVQSKLNLFHIDTEYGFGEGDLCSTHIIKFEKNSQQHLVLNEFMTMTLAKLIGMQVAEVEIMPIGKYKALSVTRFDRLYDAKRHRVMRRHQIDACQALGYSVARKYERHLGSGRDVRDIREGVSLKKLFSIAEHCANPAQAKFDMLRWTIFNLLVCNADSHGKNYSFYVTPIGLEATPWYDLVNVQMYPDFDQELAMAIGDEFEANKIHAYQLMTFAEECGIKQAILELTLKQLAKAIIDNLHNLAKQAGELTEAESEYAAAYKQSIKARCEYYLTQAEEMKHIEL
ncbi:HipA domain-containing protein [Shewanella sp. 1_MG-2023]|uniref:HipA domain-containing protein n=1 Tax=unclassified Shewanella TaxID=196818 RepID=UPI0026E1DFA0|nr:MULTISPECIES: HipA domain-containing protein [unclassified Shewanella]MDO6612983.1 HipA domain-containing protein [Shewanella sp. 7_MG-2023]MDO6772837.1 HipA domain-containing protein [Shewanella sp. 2_MG-2023]MDO6795115.1 HipA domain-containing protein [Shewanella sp. 1_MG-2023]